MHNELGQVELELVRLKKRADFLRVARSRRRFAASGLVLQVADRRAPPARRVPRALGMDVSAPDTGVPDRSESAVGIGFTVSKKVGNAVARNRAKRRLRAVVAELMPTHAAPDRDYVLIGRKATLDRSYGDLLADLKQALRRTKSLVAEPDGQRSPASS